MPVATPYHRDCRRLRAQAPASPLTRLAGRGEVGSLLGLVRRTAVQPLGSRFSDGSHRPLYAAEDPRTCVAEVLHHWGRFFQAAEAPGGALLTAAVLAILLDGDRFLDIRVGHDELHDPQSYRASQRFGLEAWMAGEDGILYRSVRDPGGTFVAALRPEAAGMPRERGERRFVWDGGRFQDIS